MATGYTGGSKEAPERPLTPRELTLIAKPLNSERDELCLVELFAAECRKAMHEAICSPMGHAAQWFHSLKFADACLMMNCDPDIIRPHLLAQIETGLGVRRPPAPTLEPDVEPGLWHFQLTPPTTTEQRKRADMRLEDRTR